MKSFLPPRLLALGTLLMLCLPLAAAAAPEEMAPVAGVDYVEIPDGQPYSPRDGRIEVAEIFSYTCPHCAHFEPELAAWAADIGDDVKVVPVPAPFGGPTLPYARAYFAAEQLGLAGRTHPAMFDALHVEQSLPISRPQPAEIAAFYARHGADPQQFVETMAGAGVDAKLRHARSFIEHSFGDDRMGTPAIVIAGRYRITGDSVQDVLDTARALVERERAARNRQPL